MRDPDSDLAEGDQKRPQFGLRSLLLFMTLISFGFAWVAYSYRPEIVVESGYGQGDCENSNCVEFDNFETESIATDVRYMIRKLCEEDPKLRTLLVTEESIRIGHYYHFFYDGGGVLRFNYYYPRYVVTESESPFEYFFRTQRDKLTRVASEKNAKVDQAVFQYVSQRIAQKNSPLTN